MSTTTTTTNPPTCPACAAARLELHFSHIREVYQAPAELADAANEAHRVVDVTASVIDWVLTMYRATNHRELAHMTAVHRLLREVSDELLLIAEAEPDQKANRAAAILAQEMRDRLPEYTAPTWQEVNGQQTAPDSERMQRIVSQAMEVVVKGLVEEADTLVAVERSLRFAREHFTSKANAEDVADELDHASSHVQRLRNQFEATAETARKFSVTTIALPDQCECDDCQARREKA